MSWLTPHLASVIVSIATLIAALATTFYVRQVKVHINSRMTELLVLTEKAAHAAGMSDAATAATTARVTAEALGHDREVTAEALGHDRERERERELNERNS